MMWDIIFSVLVLLMVSLSLLFLLLICAVVWEDFNSPSKDELTEIYDSHQSEVLDIDQRYLEGVE